MAIFPFLFGATLAAAPAVLPGAEPPNARYPALWVINDSDTVIYLFGTFHTLDQRSDWFGQAVKTAFVASDQLMLETLVPRPEGERRVQQTGDFAPVAGLAPASPAVPMAGSGSYLATSKTVMNAGRSSGLSTAHGADAVLRDAADEAGKPVGALESLQFQMTMYSSLPSASPPPQDARTAQAVAALLVELRTAWSRGDLDHFYPMLMRMRVHSPQAYRTMFYERNSRWAHWIAERLKSPGTVFIAVGAGHLSGPDSVQSKLAGLGVRSARVN
jgi:uncharacterized protein